MKTKTFAEKAYKYTQIESGRTQSQITDMLNDIGITDVRVTQIGQDYQFEFYVKLRHDEAPRKVRIELPILTELGEKPRSFAKRKNVLFRVLYYHLKDKFVAISNGIKEFEEEFLADLVIVADGKEQRLGDIIVPQYKHQLKKGSVAILNIKQGN